jgi:hypothetical protein
VGLHDFIIALYKVLEIKLKLFPAIIMFISMFLCVLHCKYGIHKFPCFSEFHVVSETIINRVLEKGR